MANQRHPEPPPEVSSGHEERDIAARPIALAALGLAGVCVLAFVLMLRLFDFFAALHMRQSAAPSPLAAAYGLKEPSEPRLKIAPLQDLLTLRARDAAALDAYAWVDREAGVVRIPIERAMAVLAERGLPVRAATPQEKP